MNVVERGIPAPVRAADRPPEAPAVTPAPAPRRAQGKLRPLVRLMPYVARYRGQAIAALVRS